MISFSAYMRRQQHDEADLSQYLNGYRSPDGKIEMVPVPTDSLEPKVFMVSYTCEIQTLILTIA